MDRIYMDQGLYLDVVLVCLSVLLFVGFFCLMDSLSNYGTSDFLGKSSRLK